MKVCCLNLGTQEADDFRTINVKSVCVTAQFCRHWLLVTYVHFHIEHFPRFSEHVFTSLRVTREFFYACLQSCGAPCKLVRPVRLCPLWTLCPSVCARETHQQEQLLRTKYNLEL
jgi:hypothetical protein